MSQFIRRRAEHWHEQRHEHLSMLETAKGTYVEALVEKQAKRADRHLALWAALDTLINRPQGVVTMNMMGPQGVLVVTLPNDPGGSFADGAFQGVQAYLTAGGFGSEPEEAPEGEQ